MTSCKNTNTLLTILEDNLLKYIFLNAALSCLEETTEIFVFQKFCRLRHVYEK